jgi:benzylsuccinate CoA-transferase BbsE subunit
LLCGKILADLSADVIQIEPLGGSTARHIGPFYQGEIYPEKSLFWWAYALHFLRLSKVS